MKRFKTISRLFRPGTLRGSSSLASLPETSPEVQGIVEEQNEEKNEDVVELSPKKKKKHDIDKSSRASELRLLLDTARDIEKTRHIIHNLEQGKLPMDTPESEQEAMRVHAHLVLVKQELLSFEQNVAKECEGVERALEVYKGKMREKLLHLRATLEAQRQRQRKLLGEAQRKLDRERIRKAVQGLSAFSKARFLQMVIKAQSTFRAHRAKKQFQLAVRSAVRIQKAFRRSKARRRQEQAHKIRQLPQSMMQPVMQKLAATRIQAAFRAKQGRRERKTREHHRMSMGLRNRAALRMWKTKLTHVMFSAWRDYVLQAKVAKDIMQHAVEKYYLQRISFAFKRWWLVTREHYEMRTIAGSRVLVRSYGARMPCPKLYKGFYSRPGPKERGMNDCFREEGSWRRDYSIVEQGSPRTLTQDDSMDEIERWETHQGSLISSCSSSTITSQGSIGKRRNGVLVQGGQAILNGLRRDSRGSPVGFLDATQTLDWALPKRLAQSKQSVILKGLSNQDATILPRLGRESFQSICTENTPLSQELVFELQKLRKSRGPFSGRCRDNLGLYSGGLTNFSM